MVGAEQLDAKVDELVQALCAASPEALRSCKALLHQVAGRDIDAALIASTVQTIADVRSSAQGREGVQSFLDKRKPDWLVPKN